MMNTWMPINNKRPTVHNVTHRNYIANLAVLLALLLSVSALEASEVMPDGSYTQTIEIKIPPGTNGMQPNLSLQYNSNGQNGTMGVGWVLHGLPTIARTSNGNGINFQGTDSYSAAGERLIDISGNGSVFHASIEKFAKYEPSYGNCNLPANEPCSWVMTDAGGHRYFFGTDPNSRNLTESGHVAIWLIDKVVDLNGNYYTIEYEKDAGAVYPSRIIYTQNSNGGLSRFRTIEFVYDKNRTDITPEFNSGIAMTMKWRLSDIVIRTGVTQVFGVPIPISGDLVRRYHLTYSYGIGTGRSRLASIQEFGHDNVTALPGMAFSWHDGPLNSGFQYPATVLSTLQNPVNVSGNPTNLPSYLFTGDFNGDGKADIASSTAGSTPDSGWCIQHGNGYSLGPKQCITGGLVTQTSQTIYDPLIGINVTFPSSTVANIFVGDFNGDGKLDLATPSNNSGAWCVMHGSNFSFSAQVCMTGGLTLSTKPYRTHAVVADYNQDGRTDILTTSGNGIWCVMYGNGTSFTARQCGTGGIVAQSDQLRSNVLFGDINGDGRLDAVASSGNGDWCVMHGNGTLFSPKQCISGGIVVPEAIKDEIFFADFNGDGQMDVANNGCVMHGNQVALAAPKCADTFTVPGRPLALNALVGDFDGDRRADVLIANGGRNWCLSRGNELAFAPPICIADGTDISEVVYGYNSPYTLTQPVPLPTYFYTGDFNGDGRLDVAAMVERSGYWSFMSGLPSGLGRAEMSLGIELNMPSAVRIENILFADFTGDGRLDIIARTPDNGGFLLSNGRPASSDNDLLNGVITPWGGQIEIYYQEAKAIPGAIVESSLNFPIMPNKSNRRMVTTLRVGDGRGNQYSTSYGYFNGKILAGHANERKDLGFEWCQKTNIKTGIRTKTYFRQDNPDLAYRKWREEEYNGAGQLMLRMDNSWARTDTFFFGTHFVALTQQRISTYETGSLLHVHTKEFTFDSYGNTGQVLDSASGAETIQTLATYETITSQNILNRKIEEKMIYNPTNQNVLISWKKMGYTGNVMTSEEKYVENTGWLITRLAHDIYGNVVSITDPRGSGPGDPMYTTQITYDNDYHALRVQMVNPLGHGEKIRYDSLKINITEEEDANGNVQRKEYDVFGRLRQIIEPGDAWTKEIIFVSEGNPQAQFMEVRYADNSGTGFRFERSYYDGLDRIYKEEKKGYTEINGANSTTYLIESRFDFFDETKNLSRQSKPFIVGKQTPVYDSIIYDNYARPVQQQTSDGYTIDFSYNASCPVNTACQSKIDAEGYAYKIITDARNRVIRREDPEGGLVITEFLPLQEKFYDAGGLVTTMNYDTAGRNTSMLDRNSGLWVYLRDNAGNIIMQVAPDGKRISNTYDALNRLLVKSYPGNTTGETNVTYQYDDSNVANGKGRVTRVIDASGETLFGYDAKGNIASWARVMPNISGSGNITVAFKADYDQQKRIKKLTYPDGSAVSQLYADAGYLRQVRLVSPGGFFGAPAVTYEGPDLGQKFVRKTGNNVTELIGYDPATHRPTSLETVLPNAVSLRTQRYDYDGNGNTLAITDILNDGARTETFTYDGLNRISSAVGAYGSRSYIHDARGRLIVKDNAAQSFGDASHPEAVTNSTEGTYAYDLNGNMMNRLARQYIYDSENRLKEIKQGTATKQNFIYDFSGFRAIKAREDGTKTYYFGGLKNYGALYEITMPPGSSTPQHTKYIYGINSDRAAQVTVPNANLVAINASAQDTLAGMQSWGSVSGIAMKINHTLNGYVIGFVTAGKHWKIFALVVTSVLFLLITFLTVRTRCENRYWCEHKPVFFSAPVILAVFTLFYGIGCASTPTTPSDVLPDSGDVSSAPVVGSVGGDTTMKGLPATGTFFFHYNHVGSLNYITNTAGQVVSEYSYLPYGEIDLGRSSGPDIARYKFATYERDEESGLDNANARIYNPQTGKFTSPDTVIPGDGQRSMGYNRYAYTEGNPIRYNDPTGHCRAEDSDFAPLTTIPAWHMYTGPGRRSQGFSCQPITVLDEISQQHDRDEAVLLGDAFFNPGFGQDVATNMKNMRADAKFIGKFLTNVLSLRIFWGNYEKAWQQFGNSGEAGWLAALIMGTLYSTTDLAAGLTGVALFSINIVVNQAAYTATKYYSGAMNYLTQGAYGGDGSNGGGCFLFICW